MQGKKHLTYLPHTQKGQRKMNEKKFYETIEEIKKLGEIKSVAYKITEDRDDWKFDKWSVCVEDTAGKTVEIGLHVDPKSPGFEMCFAMESTFIQLILIKLYGQRKEDGTNAAMNVFISGMDGITEELNRARHICPYTGKTWVNEDYMAFHDWVNPVYKV